MISVYSLTPYSYSGHPPRAGRHCGKAGPASPEEHAELSKIAHERDGLGPIIDPAFLRQVAKAIVAWRERRQAEGRQTDDHT
jgi:hypothetical protein